MQTSLRLDGESQEVLTRLMKKWKNSQNGTVLKALWDAAEREGFASNGELLEDWTAKRCKEPAQ